MICGVGCSHTLNVVVSWAKSDLGNGWNQQKATSSGGQEKVVQFDQTCLRMGMERIMNYRSVTPMTVLRPRLDRAIVIFELSGSQQALAHY